ncbi:coiled-coil domain-containing protein 89 [Ambystoma mexicanum]|uniref:coiled-coil domain-containing protein 89 n=1 Tax=Ambystoma mexicanum TaxID=8296 RepID=UPI0037E771A9
MGDVGGMKDTLKKLQNLTMDDKTENAMLRSRIDEQSQLICALKRRADETLLRCQALEAINTELEAAQEDVAVQLRRESRRADLLERRFADLASNHQQMIQFKDEYKAQNEELRQECAQLRRENEDLFIEPLRVRDEKIQQLSEEVKRLAEELTSVRKESANKMAALQAREDDRLQKQRQHESSHALELQALHVELQQAEKDRQHADARCKSLAEEHSVVEHQLEALVTEKQELLHLSMQRGKVIQDKQRYLAQLEERLRMAEQGRRTADERYQLGVAEVDANLKVQALRRQLVEAEEKQDSLQKEFEGFKRHSADLLGKERELNAKLRHLIG